MLRNSCEKAEKLILKWKNAIHTAFHVESFEMNDALANKIVPLLKVSAFVI
ncbi:hypothetical protein [Bartonella tribocorum]|uniref:hypothetical protein n=1 Tax=Bartonella tribocorum TaxID=85701 RepID=UPI001AECBBB7|nr:hypothetical protein [Bartonella tribocorum]